MWEALGVIGTILGTTFGVFATWPELWEEFSELVLRWCVHILVFCSGMLVGTVMGGGEHFDFARYAFVGSIAMTGLFFGVIPRVVAARTRKRDNNS